ncbi:phospholipid transport system substrate-binding protein [Cognatishimia maritima]|uniref:Phospholipid transport system substrate-binding protein n=2 Tax=Cognatishimia maritima TaxID=870908 RepID=A0A1M5NKY2_9RHOB|nr:ABC transporter substrate-binding protein [Cognatishimia maritima]SHG90236.1 phospholipid transport system substrate-binding protein [Cognatishimia maritima]
MNRRGFIAALAATAALPSQLMALTSSQAEVLVGRLVDDINKVIASGKSLSTMVRDFEGIFKRYGDVKIIALSALGPDARGLSGAQERAYVDAFTGYISRKYGKRFNEFVGGRIEVDGTRKVNSFYEVQGTAYLKGEAPFQLNFLVSDRSGKDLFFDMIIEGISLRLTEKSEIGAMLDKQRGNIDGLITELKKAG